MNHITPIPAFNDNYIWLIDPVDSGNAEYGDHPGVFVVDPGQADPVIDRLEQLELPLRGILITHHHYDHIGGIKPLLHRYNDIPVYGPAIGNIAALSHPLHEDDTIVLSEEYSLSILETPGHTDDHLVYYGAGALFCGDTLFAGGCGRVTDGNATQLYHSLRRLSQLPDNTRVYCAHEYTLSNLRFALLVEPDNKHLQKRLTHTMALRSEGRCTLPSTLLEEKQTNPFLRCHLPAVRAAAEAFAQRSLPSPEAIFATIRFWKDSA